VAIARGTYTEHDIKISKSMNLQGESRTNTIINAENLGTIFKISPGLKVTMSNLSLIKGHSNYGGAIQNTGSNLTVSNCNLYYNTANIDGGAIKNSLGTVTMTGSTLSSNLALDGTGGAMVNDRGTLSISYSSFSYNRANRGWGGAIHNYFGKLYISKCAFNKNQSPTGGGAILNRRVH